MLSIERISKSEYDSIISDKHYTFLQKSYWAEFRVALGEYSAEYFHILKDDKEIGAFISLVKYKGKGPIKIKAAYIPRTTLFFKSMDLLDPTLYKSIIQALKIRSTLTLLELDYPHWEEDHSDSELWKRELEVLSKNNHLPSIKTEIQPSSTLVKFTGEENLIESFPSSNARRNIKRGLKEFEKSNLKFIVKSKLNEEELLQAFELIEGISRDKKFLTRNLDYFKKLQETIPECNWYLFVDESQNNKIVLANLSIINPSSSTNYDLYIGRAVGYDNLYLSFLLKYFSFEYLNKIGIKYYDHWGISLDQNSPKYNFSVFKMHFGGRVIHYPKILLLSKRSQFFINKVIKLLNK
jgi:lipid II:glycine glycyltransferase (peptidoglycan interpeptide bridge formation enzyme)